MLYRPARPLTSTSAQQDALVAAITYIRLAQYLLNLKMFVDAASNDVSVRLISMGANEGGAMI